MADDFAPLGISVDTRDVVAAKANLESLAGVSDKVVSSLDKIEVAAQRTGKSLATLGQGSQGTTTAAANLDTLAKAETSVGAAAAAIPAQAAAAGASLTSLGTAAGNAATGLTTAQTATAGIGQSASVIPQRLNGVASSFQALGTASTGAAAALTNVQAAQSGIAAGAQAVARGVAPAAAAVNNLGVSAKQTAAALRGVPAQFTDIVTSIQGGQAPLTVLLQQGGQLKDMFGGIGPAARALGGYILGLVNPYTLAAAAVAGLALAYQSGAKESENYNKALILSGNAAGTTVGQLQIAAKSIDGLAGSQSRAAGALAEFAQSGAVGAQNLGKFTEAALIFEKATGQAISATIKQFDSLRDEPVKAVLKLNEGMNFLTLSTYNQIKALADQGKATEAANVAQNAFADTLKSRGTEILANVGLVERAWNAVKGAVLGAASAIAEIGRQSAPATQLAQVNARIAQLQREQSAPTFGSTGGGAATGGANARPQASGAAELAALQARQVALGAIVQQENDIAAIQRVQGQRVEAAARFDAQSLQVADNRAKREKEIAQARADGALAGKSDVEIAKQVAAINEKYKDPKTSGAAGTGQSEVASLKARILDEQTLIDRLRENGLTTATVTAAEKTRNDIQAQLKTSLSGAARSEKEKALALANVLVSTEAARIAEEKRFKGLQAARAESDKQVESAAKAAATTKDQADKQEAANAVFGKGTAAVQEMVLAQLKLQLAEADSSDTFIPAYVAALRLQVGEQERLVAALKQTDYKAIQQQQTELNRTAQDSYDLAKLEFELIGTTATERERIVAARQAELEVAKRTAEIERTVKDPDQRASLISEATETATINAQARVLKSMSSEYQKSVDQYNDVFRKGFADLVNGGKGTWKAFTQSLATTFKTTVADTIYKTFAQPFVVKILASVLGLVGGATSAVAQAAGVAGAAGGGANVLGAANLASSANTAYSAGSYLAGGGSLANLAGVTYANATTVGAGTALDGLLASNAAFGTAASTATSTALAAVSAAAPYVAAAAGLYLALKKGEFKQTDSGVRVSASQAGGLSVGGFEIQKRSGGLFGSDEERTIDSSISPDLAAALQKTYAASTAGLSATLASLGIDFSKQIGNFVGESFDIGLRDQTPDQVAERIARYFNTLTEAQAKAVLDSLPDQRNQIVQKDGETTTQSLTRLSTSLQAVNPVLAALGETVLQLSISGGNAASALVDLFGSIDNLKAAGSSFLQNFYSQAQRDDLTRGQVRGTLAGTGLDLPTTRDEFRDLVEAQDLMTESGRKAYATLLSVNAAFASFTPTAEDAAKAAQDVAEDAAKAAQDVADAAKIVADNARQGIVDAVSDTFDTLSRSIDAQSDLLNAAFEEASTAAQKSIDDIGASVSKLTSLSETLHSALSGLEISGGAVQQRTAAQSFISASAAQARAGGALNIDQTKLSAALSVVTQPSEKLFSSYVDYARDFARTANTIADLSKATDGSLSAQKTLQQIAEQQLSDLDKAHQEDIKRLDKLKELAQAQLDAINGVNTSVLSITDALRAFNGAVVTAGGNAISGTGVPTIGAPVPPSYAGALSSAFQSDLGRDISPQELANYQAIIDSGAATLQAALDGIKQSAEYLARINGSHAAGLAYVPFDGYRAELHRGERVLTEAQSRDYAAPRVRAPAATDTTASEIALLREQVVVLIEQVTRGADGSKQAGKALDDASRGNVPLKTKVTA